MTNEQNVYDDNNNDVGGVDGRNDLVNDNEQKDYLNFYIFFVLILLLFAYN